MINAYDCVKVTYDYLSHKIKRVEKEIVEVYIFTWRMMQHILPNGFKSIRYYAVQ